MANNVYNYFTVFGSEKVLAVVDGWWKKLKVVQGNDDLRVHRAKISEVIYGVEQGGIDLDFGSKWLEYEEEFSFCSAWGPPNQFQDHMLISLCKIDPNVIVANSYNNEDGSAGFRYVVLNDKGEVDDSACYEVSSDDFDTDEEDWMEEVEVQCVKYEYEYLCDLVDAYERLAPYLESRIENLRNSAEGE